MKKEPKSVSTPEEYFRLKRGEKIHMFCLETITVVDGKVTAIESTEETFLPIAFDKFRRKAGEQFFRAVEETK